LLKAQPGRSAASEAAIGLITMNRTASTHLANRSAVRAILGGLTIAIGRFFQRLAENDRMRRDAAILLRMNDHALQDIGLNRADVQFAVRNGCLPDR
jgi:uncharacterized protein YjiS (DUF1127 family)